MINYTLIFLLLKSVVILDLLQCPANKDFNLRLNWLKLYKNVNIGSVYNYCVLCVQTNYLNKQYE